jgi:hypothetical protein
VHCWYSSFKLYKHYVVYTLCCAPKSFVTMLVSTLDECAGSMLNLELAGIKYLFTPHSAAFCWL